MCSAQCKEADGCWGPADNHCRRCANYRLFDARCVAACDASVLNADQATTRSLYVANATLLNGERQCRHCHPQCNGTCYGDVCNSRSISISSSSSSSNSGHGWFRLNMLRQRLRSSKTNLQYHFE